MKKLKRGKSISDSEIEEIMSHSQQLRSNYDVRNDMLKEIEDIYFMKPTDVPVGEHIKETISPDGHNAILNASRMLGSKDPNWDIPDEFNSEKMRTIASKLEKWCGATWYGASRVRRKPIHSEASLMSLLYGEVHIKVTRTKDLVDTAVDEFYKRRAERALSISPLLFDVLNPKNGYAEFDMLGLSAYHTHYKTKVDRMRTAYGGLLADLTEDMKPNDDLTFNEYWSHQYHMVWFDEFGDDPIIAVENDKPWIPVIVQFFEGSDLFTEEDQELSQPFLYTAWKSGIHKRLTLNLTTLYTNIYTMAANPTFLYERNQPDKQLALDFSVPGGIAYIDRGESLTQLVKEPIHPAFLEGMRVAENKFIESTIYKTALGEPMGANAAYSMVALLHQSGKLPLYLYKELLEYAYADAMKLGIEMLKNGGGKYIPAMGKDGVIEVNFSEIPETYELTTTIDLDLPQDERQNVIMAVQATYGDDPLLSKSYARRKMLGIKQPDVIDDEIFREKMNQIMAAQYLQQMQQKEMQQAQMQQQQQQMQQQMQPQGRMDLPDEIINSLRNMQQTGVAGVPLAGPQMCGRGMGEMPNITGKPPMFPEENVESEER